MKTGYKVRDVMTESPVVMAKNATLQEAAEVMGDKKVGALLIVEDGIVLGILTEQDLVRKAIKQAKDCTKTTVFDIMETSLITISADEDIFEALKKMGENNIRHLPVFEGKNFAGLVTSKDILKVQPQLFELLAEKIQLKEQKRKMLKLKADDIYFK